MFVLYRIYRSVKDRGIVRTSFLAIAEIADHYFDFRYRTDTMSVVPVSELGVADAAKKGALPYKATRMMPLRKLFRRLTFPANATLIDLGCGKGRVLLIASQCGFETARGVEFSARLCEVARSNCANFKERAGVATTFEVFESDVVDYVTQDDENVFFMYRPFVGTVMRKVLANIAASVEANPRQVWIVYHTAQNRRAEEAEREYSCGHVIEEHGLFAKVKELVLWGCKFEVYSNQV